MTSGRQAKRRRRVQAPPPPVRGVGGGRHASPKVLAGGAAAVALVTVVIALAFVLSRGSTSSAPTTGTRTLPDADVVTQLFKGIPQHGNILGSPKAPVRLVEYIDVQCPVCRAFETQVLPTILSRYVRTGKVKIEARPITAIGLDSERGHRAVFAAGQQNRLFDFAQLLYFNQGQENSGWLTDSILRSVAASIPGLDVPALMRARDSATIRAEVNHFNDLATADNVGYTPEILVGKSGGKLHVVSPGGAPDVATLSAALDRALR